MVKYGLENGSMEECMAKVFSKLRRATMKVIGG